EGRLAPAVVTWSGAGANSLWSTGANWGGTPPHAGDDLVFPGGVARFAIMNDLTPGTTFATISFTGNPYNISGNPLAISGGITSTNSTGNNFLSLDVTLTAAETFN